MQMKITPAIGFLFIAIFVMQSKDSFATPNLSVDYTPYLGSLDFTPQFFSTIENSSIEKIVRSNGPVSFLAIDQPLHVDPDWKNFVSRSPTLFGKCPTSLGVP